MERVAVARQRPVDKSCITDCVSSFVVRLVFVLLTVLFDRVSLPSQLVAFCSVVGFGCCRSVALLVVLLFPIVLFSRFISR